MLPIAITPEEMWYFFTMQAIKLLFKLDDWLNLTLETSGSAEAITHVLSNSKCIYIMLCYRESSETIVLTVF